MLTSGAKVIAHAPDASKLASCATPAVFLGPDVLPGTVSNGTRLYFPMKKHIIVERNFVPAPSVFHPGASAKIDPTTATPDYTSPPSPRVASQHFEGEYTDINSECQPDRSSERLSADGRRSARSAAENPRAYHKSPQSDEVAEARQHLDTTIWSEYTETHRGVRDRAKRKRKASSLIHQLLQEDAPLPRGTRANAELCTCMGDESDVDLEEFVMAINAVEVEAIEPESYAEAMRQPERELWMAAI